MYVAACSTRVDEVRSLITNPVMGMNWIVLVSPPARRNLAFVSRWFAAEIDELRWNA